MKIAFCLKCGLNFGKYINFHMYPGNVEMERCRHNCNLIKLASLWDREVFYMPFYTRQPVAEADDRSLPMEDEVTAAKHSLRAKLMSFKDAEIEACSTVFAAANAFRSLRADPTMWSYYTECHYLFVLNRTVGEHNPWDYNCPPPAVIAEVLQDAFAPELASSHSPVNEVNPSTLCRATVAVRAADRARAVVTDRFVALQNTMQVLRGHAIMAGNIQLPDNPDVTSYGEIMFIDEHDPAYDEFNEGRRVMDA